MDVLKAISRFLKDEDGATAVEYGLIATFIAAVIIASVYVFGNKVNNSFTSISNKMP